MTSAIPGRLRTVLDAPPRTHSPAPIWWWSGERLDRRRLRDQLERFASGGVHNLVILNLAPSGPMFGANADEPAFFTDTWWELLDGVCEDASELGVSLWFYDQLGFSGADIQARLVRDVPAYAGQWLEPGGGASTRGFDYLSEQACATLLDRVHGEFERRLGHRLGNPIVGSFQDELPSIPTWTRGFAEAFATRRGYDLAPHLPSLWKETDDAGLRVRRDYHLTRAELAEEAFFRPLAEWHRRHGLTHGCDQQDPARAGHPVDGVRLYADYARTHRWFGAPGSDHHGDGRVHASLAHLYGRDRVWIEAFHSSGWGGTLEETFDWLLPWLRAGATLYNPHAAYYTTKAGWWEWAPPSTDWRQPYWRHYRVFAEAVTRLCAVLSMGRHVCDVAVLLPTATAQAGTRLDGVASFAAGAQETYRALVGDMAWFQMVPGVLDRSGIDADVIDDDSVQRAVVTGGRLAVAEESYGTVLLPACTVLEGDTARRLTALIEAGGRVIAIGPPPRLGVGDPAADEAVARLASLVDTVADTGSLGPALRDARRVEAPVPALVREVDGATVVFVTASASMASRVSVGRPGERGVDLGWLDVTYDFDPDRYHRDMRVRVNGVEGPAFLASPFGGEPRPLPTTPGPSWVEVVVPFDDAPAALLIFPGAGGGNGDPRVLAARTGGEIDLGSTWELELVPTLDNTWGDFARPRGEMPVLEAWRLWHRVGDAPSAEDWTPVHATFGPHAVWAGPGHEWRPVVYSDTRGIRKDPIHRAVLGPKGHVPEEFLDFGQVLSGQRVAVRTRMTVPSPGGHLVVGAAAAKTVVLDEEIVALNDHGYLATSKTRLPAGSYTLELLLVPDEDVRLRGHLSVTTEPAACLRPEWMTLAGVPRPGARVVFTTELPAGHTRVLQVTSAAACRILVDGVEIGRQGGFDPYAEQDAPRVGRYTLPDGPGSRLTLVLTENRTPASVLVDGPVVSGAGWRATREGAAVPVVVRRAQHGDPAALHLRRRPHPLPAARWLEDEEDDGTVLPTTFAVPGASPRTEWLRCTVPPGATRMRLNVRAEVTGIVLDGVALQPTRAGDAWDIELPGEHRPSGTVEVRLRTAPGHQEGAALAGPVQFEVGRGTIDLGDWEDTGLAGYSGGVRYHRVLALDTNPESAVLDLGHVRGTAEVTVNGTSTGVRICAPYTFDLGTALRRGRNEIDIVVYGTLAPYLDDASPTHFVFEGQRTTGLLGPVTLRMTE